MKNAPLSRVLDRLAHVHDLVLEVGDALLVVPHVVLALRAAAWGGAECLK